MYRIIFFIIIIFSNVLNADNDYKPYDNYSNITFKVDHYDKKDNKQYKVKDFYGTWVAVKVRFMYDCYFNEEISQKIAKLGQEVIIKPNFFQNKLNAYNSNLVREDAFFSTEISELYNIFLGKSLEYSVLLAHSKQESDHSISGDYGLFLIKDKNTLIYFEYTYANIINSPHTLYILVKQEEAKKLDKYMAYIPSKKLKGEPFLSANSEDAPYAGCSAEYDEYAYKLIKEGKYNVIRDNTMARDFIDIE